MNKWELLPESKRQVRRRPGRDIYMSSFKCSGCESIVWFRDDELRWGNPPLHDCKSKDE